MDIAQVARIQKRSFLAHHNHDHNCRPTGDWWKAESWVGLSGRLYGLVSESSFHVSSALHITTVANKTMAAQEMSQHGHMGRHSCAPCPPQRPDALTRRTWSKSGDVSGGTCRTRGKRTRGEWRSHSEWGAVGTRPRSIELRRLLGKIRTVETARTLPLPEQFVPRVFHACIVAGSTTVGAAAKFSAPPARHTAYASGTRQLRYTAAMRRRMALPQQLRPFMVRHSACVITVSTVQYWRRWLSGCMKDTLKGLRHQMSWLTLLSGWPV